MRSDADNDDANSTWFLEASAMAVEVVEVEVEEVEETGGGCTDADAASGGTREQDIVPGGKLRRALSIPMLSVS